MYKVSVRFSLSPKELGKCTITRVEFICSHKLTQLIISRIEQIQEHKKVIDKSVESMESDDIIEKSPSAWGSPGCIVAKTDEPSRLCIDYRNTINKHCTVRETWSTSDIESHIDTVAGASKKGQLQHGIRNFERQIRRLQFPYASLAI